MTLLSNTKWNMFSQLVKIAVQIINIVYLATIIPPAQYGLMAMALVVFNLGVLLRDLGTSAAIIQRKDLSDSLINTIFWLNLLMGFSLAIIISLSAPFIAYLYGQPKLISILIILSVTFPLSSVAATHLALLERSSNFKKISFIEITSSLVSVVIAIALANLGFGVYSLVVQAIVLNMMSAVQFFMASSWRPTSYKLVDIEELRNIFRFSANLSLFNFINYFSRNADSFIIGKFMTASVLGNYSLAYRIMLFPLQSLTFVTTRSLYPILSKNQHDNNKIISTYTKCVFVILLITTPLMSGLAYYSNPFVSIVFGEKWAITSDILKWLAPTAIIQSVVSTSGSVFMAKGRTDVLMKLGIVAAILQVGSFLIGVQYTITFFSMCYLIANAINFFPSMFFLMKVINGKLSIFLLDMLPIFIATILMLIGLSLLNLFYDKTKIESAYVLILFSFYGAMIYTTAIMLFSKRVRNILRNHLLGRLN